MYNYILHAQNNGIKISDKMYNTTIKKYQLNKEDNNIRIEYMNGTTELMPIEETSLEKLKQEQEQSFKEIKRKTGIHVGIMNGLKIALLGTNIFLSTAYFIDGNTRRGVAFLLLGTSMALNKTGSKAYSEMRLVSWLLDNKDNVNAMIKEDVERYASGDTIKFVYPSEKVLYPKEMYEEGINLNNIENLSVNELKLIKKKTKQREKLLRNK